MRDGGEGLARGDPIHRRWTMIAEHGDGPWIPAMAVPLLADKARTAWSRRAPAAPPEASAWPMFERAFADFAMATAIEESGGLAALRAGHGRRISHCLPEAVRALHLVNGELGAAGMAEVIRGGSWLARLIGGISGFPAAAAQVPISGADATRRTASRPGAAISAARLLRAGCRRTARLLVERFGPIRFAMACANRGGRPDHAYRQMVARPGADAA